MVHVLGSRTLIRPLDPAVSREFYGDRLGLAVYREFGTGEERGTVYFLGGGFLELSGRRPAGADGAAPDGAVRLWLQVADASAARDELAARGVEIVREPVREPWGLIEMWIADPDGLPIVLVEIPADHPLRHRPGI
ncbi:VOC family protein [Streptomyces sp. UH6]|uniref:VOC family protein n=1 Tax=Streptomyces sp. UH6 TaxID=2748379 RepID=UPI0015D4B269|nr:VOC family protein [Streptomyces sp. UH6]NYV76690.1 VOC family protein [Streptomyces sp. UH6]